MQNYTLGKSLINAKPVTSVLAEQDVCGNMKDCTLEKNLINAKPVTIVLAEQKFCGDIKEPTMEKRLFNTKPAGFAWRNLAVRPCLLNTMTII